MKVIVCGYYGANNRGDDLILKVLTDYLKNKDVEIVVTSLSPDSTSREYGVKAIQSSRSLKKGFATFIIELFNADLFILGGGGLYQDYGKHFRIVLFYALRVLAAVILRKKIAYFALGVGNIEMERSKRLIRFVTSKVDVITVRDEGSKRLLTDLGVTKAIAVCADPVFLLKTDQLPPISPQSSLCRHIGISVLPYDQQLHFSSGIDENIENSIVQFTNFLVESNYEVTFIPMEKTTDDNFISKILGKGKMKGPVTVLNSSLSHDEFISKFAAFHAVVAMRLHAIILSATLGIPFIPITYHSKVTNTVSLLKQDDLMVRIDEISFDQLKTNFTNLIDSYSMRKKVIMSKATLLRQRAQLTFDHLDSVL